MKLFLAGSEPANFRLEFKKANIKRILFSFFYINKTVENFNLIQSQFSHIFIDSGGFSARTKGKEINVEEYANYLKMVEANKKPGIDLVYANLDLADTEGTLRNQKYLEGQGLTPIPVYHASELFDGDTKTFFDYIEKYDYIAIGGVVSCGYSHEQITHYLNFIFKHTKNKVKVHGFGITNKKIIRQYPFYSVDSTSWQQGMRYGGTVDIRGKSVSLKSKKQMLDGNVPISFMSNHFLKRVGFELNFWKTLEKNITELWKAKGVEWKD